LHFTGLHGVISQTIKLYRKYASENFKGTDNVKRLGTDETQDYNLKKYITKTWTGFNWLRIGTSGRLM
jgi:hypothetical protein